MTDSEKIIRIKEHLIDKMNSIKTYSRHDENTYLIYEDILDYIISLDS